MRIQLIDPSLYAPQYNDPLAGALAAEHEVVVIGRPERPDQVRCRFPVDPHFYRVSERLRRRSVRAGQVLKPLEHGVDLLRLVARARRERPTVVHLQWAVVPLLDRLALRAIARSCPVVFTVHDTKTMHGSGNVAQRAGMAAVIKAADAVVVHTEHSRKVLEDAGVPDHRIHVVPHGPVGRHGHSERAAGPVRLLEYGKIRPYKGIDILIEALAHLRPEATQLRVTIAGEPLIDVAPLQRLARDRQVDHLIDWELGYISETRTEELLASHDVMVLPYTDIDSSGVLAMAQMWPMPVVASRVGGFAEQLAACEGAVLFDTGDPAALATALGGIIDPGHLEVLRKGARADVDRLPSWDEAARLTVELYERLLAAR